MVVTIVCLFYSLDAQRPCYPDCFSMMKRKKKLLSTSSFVALLTFSSQFFFFFVDVWLWCVTSLLVSHLSKWHKKSHHHVLIFVQLLLMFHNVILFVVRVFVFFLWLWMFVHTSWLDCTVVFSSWSKLTADVQHLHVRGFAHAAVWLVGLKLNWGTSIYSKPPNTTSVAVNHISLLKTFNKIDTAFFPFFLSLTLWCAHAQQVTAWENRGSRTHWKTSAFFIAFGWEFLVEHARWMRDGCSWSTPYRKK